MKTILQLLIRRENNMNNQELELRVKEILAVDNFFDMVEATMAFEKEYKQSDFYKHTKMSLMDVIKNSKMWYLVNLDELFTQLQNKINDLDFSNINGMLDQMGNIFGQENTEIMEMIQEVKDIKF